MNRSCTLREHFGKSVDLSCAEVFDALSGCECKLVDANVHIKYKGTWYELIRTDLLDDVCTARYYNEKGHGSAMEYAEWMRDKTWFGARLKHYPHGNFFAVVDSASDG